MRFRLVGIAAAILLGTASLAGAQSAPADPAAPANPTAAPAAPAPGPAINVDLLPIDLSRIQRRLEAEAAGTGRGLRFSVNVFGVAPPLEFFRPDANLLWGPAPYGPPTHAELMYMITPEEFRSSPMMDFSAVLRWVNAQRKRDQERDRRR